MKSRIKPIFAVALTLVMLLAFTPCAYCLEPATAESSHSCCPGSDANDSSKDSANCANCEIQICSQEISILTSAPLSIELDTDSELPIISTNDNNFSPLTLVANPQTISQRTAHSSSRLTCAMYCRFII